MAVYQLYVFDMSYITTNGPDFTHPDGSQYTLGVSTVTITPGATAQPVSVDDPDDAFFDDDDPVPQTVVGNYTVNGTSVPDNSEIEAEYLMEVQDSGGTSYFINAVSFFGDPYAIDGFTVHGAVPPFGEPLTVVNTYEALGGSVPYTSSSPACFDAQTRIRTPEAWVEAGRLRRGQTVCLASGGTAELGLVLRQRVCVGPERESFPVRIQSGALGAGQPSRRLILSPHHRVWHVGLQALVPARALIGLPKIGLLKSVHAVNYVHLVLPRHALIVAEGCVCESFWPGEMALAGLPPQQRNKVRAAMGAAPKPCAPMLTMRQAQVALAVEEGAAV